MFFGLVSDLLKGQSGFFYLSMVLAPGCLRAGGGGTTTFSIFFAVLRPGGTMFTQCANVLWTAFDAPVLFTPPKQCAGTGLPTASPPRNGQRRPHEPSRSLALPCLSITPKYPFL